MQTMRHEGVRALYRGYLPALARQVQPASIKKMSPAALRPIMCTWAGDGDPDADSRAIAAVGWPRLLLNS